jgi:hypothetical protein
MAICIAAPPLVRRPLTVSHVFPAPRSQADRQHCGVRRFWNGEDEEIGWLVHKPGGAEHARWVFDYDPGTTDDDEAGYRFGMHAFAPGEYVSIDGHEGGSHTFRVVSVEPAA